MLYSPALLRDMQRETADYLQAHFESGDNLMRIFDSDWTFANHRLGLLYGTDDVASSSEFQVWQLPSAERLGVLTHASVLTATAKGSAPSPTRRAAWVAETLLCKNLPAPPPNIPTFTVEDEDAAGDLFDQHLEDPACASCHAAFDPFGWPLDAFDALGGMSRPMAEDPPALPDGTVVRTAPELARWIAGSEDARRCLTERVLTWVIGRSLQSDDVTLFDRVDAAALAGGFSFEALMQAALMDPVVLGLEDSP